MVLINIFKNNNYLRNFMKKTLFLIFLIASITALSQNARQDLRKGNKLYENKNYKDAEIFYRKSLSKDSTYFNSKFNLADAIYKQKDYEKSVGMYGNLINNETNKKKLTNLYHNIGNSLLQKALTSDTISPDKKQELVKQSMEAYKKSLRNNASDKNTKYNYEYARKYLNKIQQQQNKCQNNQDKQQKEQQQKQQQQPKQQQQQISKNDANRMLESLNNDEKKTQDKLKKVRVAGSKNKNEKDW